jgi:hypothetical protein
MAKKKKKSQVNNSVIDLPFEITKITLDNIKEFFESTSLFIVIVDGEIVNQFANRSMFIANIKHRFYHIFDNNIVYKDIKIYTSELQEDYNWAMDDMKALIKGYIAKNVLYAKKIE